VTITAATHSRKPTVLRMGDVQFGGPGVAEKRLHFAAYRRAAIWQCLAGNSVQDEMVRGEAREGSKPCGGWVVDA